MGNGQAPAGISLDSSLDDGTLVRADSPAPGVIGLDSKGGDAKGPAPSMADRIVSFARRQRGRRVGDGECYTLADQALRGAGAKSARDYGTITPNADYVWGSSVNLSELRPGDVIQFRDYSYRRVDETEDESGTTTNEVEEERPHHTAIVQSVDGNGAVTVLEQNSPEGSAVRSTPLFFSNRTTTHGNTTTRITVRGTFWFYRPESQ